MQCYTEPKIILPHTMHSFNRHTHWSNAAYQPIKVISEQLLQRLHGIKHKPRRILDIGSGNGTFTQALIKQYPRADITAIDIAHQRNRIAKRARRWRQHYYPLTANATQLPFSDDSVDMIVSNLCFYWLDNLNVLFKELHRVLQPDGLLMFSTLGPDTYHELRSAFATLDHYPHVNIFMDLHDVGDALLSSGFKDPVMDMDQLCITHNTPKTILHDLHELGEINQHPERIRHLLTPHYLERLFEAYPSHNDTYPVTLEVNYGHAWGQTISDTKQRRNAQGEVLVSIDSLKSHNAR